MILKFYRIHFIIDGGLHGDNVVVYLFLVAENLLITFSCITIIIII